MTTLLYGVDSAGPPDVSDTHTIFSLGWRFFAGYLGGPRCAFSSNGVGLGHAGRLGWGIGAFARVQNAGFLLAPPIYVGRTAPYDPPAAFTYEQGQIDGDDADNMMGQSGFDENQPVCLDAEYGDFQDEPTQFYQYVAGFTQRIKSANPNRKIELYSDMYTLGYFGPDQGFDYKWGAAYVRAADTYNPVRRGPPYGMFDPSSPPPWDMWQFSNGTRYDVNSATEDAPWALCTPPA